MIEDLIKRYEQYMEDDNETIIALRKDKPLQWETQRQILSTRIATLEFVLGDLMVINKINKEGE